MKDISGTIASGGVSQSLFNSGGNFYMGISIRNNGIGALYIEENGAASGGTPSILVRPNETYTTPYTAAPFSESWQIRSANTGLSFTARVF